MSGCFSPIFFISFQSFKHLESHIWVSTSISALCACSAVSPKLCEDGLHMTFREFLQCVLVQTQSATLFPLVLYYSLDDDN